MTRRPPGDDETRRRALRDLERAGEEGGAFGSPALKSKAKTVRDHFSARDADPSDPIEVSATRVGRALGLIAFIALAIYLFLTYSG